MNKMYLVEIDGEEYEDSYDFQVFVTDNKFKAILWVNKFNRIMEANIDRIQSFYNDNDYTKREPYLWSSLSSDKPTASYRGIEYR